jgi:hypothetical protein
MLKAVLFVPVKRLFQENLDLFDSVPFETIPVLERGTSDDFPTELLAKCAVGYLAEGNHIMLSGIFQPLYTADIGQILQQVTLATSQMVGDSHYRVNITGLSAAHRDAIRFQILGSVCGHFGLHSDCEKYGVRLRKQSGEVGDFRAIGASDDFDYIEIFLRP